MKTGLFLILSALSFTLPAFLLISFCLDIDGWRFISGCFATLTMSHSALRRLARPIDRKGSLEMAADLWGGNIHISEAG